MNVRMLTLTTCAAATALLLPTLQSGAAAEPGGNGNGQGKKCAVKLATGSQGSLGGPVIKKADLGSLNPDHPLSLGYYVDEEPYPNSSTFQATINYEAPLTGRDSTGGCGSISLLTYPYVVEDGQNKFLPLVQSRTVPLSSSATSVTIDSLVVGLPANSRTFPDSETGESVLCVGSRLQVLDSNGSVTETIPQLSDDPLDFCGGGGGGKNYL